MNRSCLGIVPLVLAGLIAAAASATAQEKFPRIEGAVPIEIHDDLNYDSEDLDNEHNQLFTKIEPEVTVHVASGLSLFAHAVIEPMRDQEAQENRAFEDEGVVIEDLFVRYETGRFMVQGGKFTPGFGVAWDSAPGIYGTDFAEAGYEFAERIGIAGSATVGGDNLGSHTLSLHTFFLDTTILSESVGRGRGTTDKVDGGVSNTEDFSSFAITADGEDVAGVEGLGYRLAYIHQAAGQGDGSDETGISVAVWHEFDLGQGFSVAPLLEFVHFDDVEGVTGQDRDFLTAVARLGWNSWNVSLATTERDTEAADGTKTDDFQFQVSAGYAFDFGLSFDVGWYIANESQVETRRLGAMLAYTVEF